MINSQNNKTYHKNELEQNPQATLSEWFALTPHETIKTLLSRVVAGFNSHPEVKITISNDENYEMPENTKTAQQITLSSDNVEDFFEYHDLAIKERKLYNIDSPQY